MWTIDPPRMIWRLDIYAYASDWPFDSQYIQDKNLKFFYDEPYAADGMRVKFNPVWVSKKRFFKLFPRERLRRILEEHPF